MVQGLVSNDISGFQHFYIGLITEKKVITFPVTRDYCYKTAKGV